MKVVLVMIDDLCDIMLNKQSLQQLKDKSIEIYKKYDYSTALVWAAANKNTNNDLGKIGEHLANKIFNWKRITGQSDSISNNGVKIEIKTSVPPKLCYRIGQIKVNYDQNQALFCQFFNLKNKELQFYYIPTIKEFICKFDSWIGNDQGNDKNIIGIRSIPHGKDCWKLLQNYKVSNDYLKGI